MTDRTASPAGGYAQALVDMRRCHAEMRARCETLRSLVMRLRAGAADAQTRRTAAELVRYFDTTARFHREDEEEDLLPRMIAASTMSRGSSLTRLVADMANEHRELEQTWTSLRAALLDLNAGEGAPDAQECDHFVKLHAMHIAVEEANVYPLAEMLLSREDFQEIAASMARRRAGV